MEKNPKKPRKKYECKKCDFSTSNRKDYNTERSLVRLVGKRRSLLDYLKTKDIERYRNIVKELGLRK